MGGKTGAYVERPSYGRSVERTKQSEEISEKNQPAPPIRWLTDPHGWSEVAEPRNSDGSAYPSPAPGVNWQVPGGGESTGLVNGGCALSLPNGRVLVLGGTRQRSSTTYHHLHFGHRVEHSLAEYDPQTGAWRIIEEPGGTAAGPCLGHIHQTAARRVWNTSLSVCVDELSYQEVSGVLGVLRIL